MRFLVREGADLSALAYGVGEEGSAYSALDVLMYNLASPVDFLRELLDDGIFLVGDDITQHDAFIEMHFDILDPHSSVVDVDVHFDKVLRNEPKGAFTLFNKYSDDP